MLRRTVLILTLLAITLTGGAAWSAEPDPMAGAPAVGDCFDITLKQAGRQSLAEDPVRCRADHTAVVIAVEALPSGLDWSSPEDETTAAVNEACRAAYAAKIGRNPVDVYRSQYSFVWFMPTAAQKEAGARWFDCLLIVLEDSALGDLPRALPRTSAKLPDSIAKCATARYAYTTCADTHAWRATHTAAVRGKPTARSVDAASQRICPRHVQSRTYLRTVWDIPGKRFVLACYTKTTR